MGQNLRYASRLSSPRRWWGKRCKPLITQTKDGEMYMAEYVCLCNLLKTTFFSIESGSWRKVSGGIWFDTARLDGIVLVLMLSDILNSPHQQIEFAPWKCGCWPWFLNIYIDMIFFFFKTPEEVSKFTWSWYCFVNVLVCLENRQKNLQMFDLHDIKQ